MRVRRPRVTKDRDLANGPGKLCLALGITGELNTSMLQRGALVIREGITYDDREIAVTPRIGITRSADWPLRWIVRDSPYISKTPSQFSVTGYSK
nr:3-methyladenine DNA glycosylase [uncultured bacterium]